MSKMALILETATKAFEGEKERGRRIQDKAEKFMAAIAAITGFQLFDFKALTAESSPGVRYPAMFALVCLAAALLAAIICVQVRTYQGYPEKSELFDKLNDPAVTEDGAAESLARVLLEARAHNAATNDRSADYLEKCGWFVLAGFLGVAASRVLAACL